MRAVHRACLLAANLAAPRSWHSNPSAARRRTCGATQQSLSVQLGAVAASASQQRTHWWRRLTPARTQGDQFLDRYFIDERPHHRTRSILAELTAAAKEAGINMGTAQATIWSRSKAATRLMMLSTRWASNGTYANLTKFVNLLDKSPRFLIIENLQAAAPQQKAGKRSTSRSRSTPSCSDGRGPRCDAWSPGQEEARIPGACWACSPATGLLAMCFRSPDRSSAPPRPRLRRRRALRRPRSQH